MDTNNSITIGPGEILQCITVTTIDDDALEGNQTFLFIISSTDSDVILKNNVTTVIIQDNDSKLI